jgi:hypothetical protein
MNLQDAHKTGRKYRRSGEEGCDWWRFGVTDAMANTSLYGEEIFADDWEVEPELYEVNTGIRSVDEISEINDECYARIKIPKVMAHKLEGKRVRATFEVLD